MIGRDAAQAEATEWATGKRPPKIAKAFPTIAHSLLFPGLWGKVEGK